MIKLRDTGIIVIKKCNHYLDCRSKYSDHYSEVVIERASNERE